MIRRSASTTRVLGLSIICLVLLLAASVDVVSQVSDDTDSTQFHDVFVYLTTQDVLMDSDSMAPEPGDADFFSLDLFGIGHSLEEWRTKTGRNDVQRLREELQSALGPFHFESSTMNILI